MKNSIGASGAFYLIVGVAFVVLLLAMPYPHLNTQTESWYLGASIISRVSGSPDADGLPLDKVVLTVSQSSVKSPLELSCTTDSDCAEYLVINQCTVYCGNVSKENSDAILMLNRQRVCEPNLWSRPKINCQCISGKCINLE
jgi:hypothetical protein